MTFFRSCFLAILPCMWLSCHPVKPETQKNNKEKPSKNTTDVSIRGSVLVEPAAFTAVASNRWEAGHFSIFSDTFEGRLGIDGVQVVPLKYHEVRRTSGKGSTAWFRTVNGRFWSLIGIWGGRHGLLDGNGRVLIPAVHQALSDPAEGRVRFVRDDKTGYLDLSGRIVIAPQFAGGRDFSEGRACVNVGGKASDNPFSFDYVSGGKWGYVDQLGKWVKTPAVDHCDAYSGGFATVQIGCHDQVVNCCDHECNGGKWGLLDLQGKWVLPPEQKEIVELARGHFMFCNTICDALGACRKACGLTGPDGRIRVPLTSDLALFEVQKNRLMTGKVPDAKRATRPGNDDDFNYYGHCNRYDPVFPIHGPRGSACETVVRSGDGRIFCKNAAGVTLHLSGVDQVGDFNGRLAPVRNGKLWGFMDADGRQIVAPIMAAGRVFSRLCEVQLDRDSRGRTLFFHQTFGETGTITTAGEYRPDSPPQKTPAGEAPDEDALAADADQSPDETEQDPELEKKNREWLRRDGAFPVNFLPFFDHRPFFQEEAEPAYWDSRPSDRELAKVYMFINECDKYEFHGLKEILVEKGGKTGLIDLLGRFLIPMNYQEITPWHETLWIVKKEEKMGLVDTRGPVVLAPVFSEILPLNDHLLRVTREGKMGVTDPTGRFALPLKYQEIRRLGEGLIGLCASGCGDMSKANWKLKKLEPLSDLPGSYAALEPAADGHILFAESCGLPQKTCARNRFGVLSPEGQVLFSEGAAEKDVMATWEVERTDGLPPANPPMTRAYQTKFRMVDARKKEERGPAFDAVRPFFAGTYWVNSGCIWKKIDREEPECKGGKWGLFSPSRGMLIPPSFDALFAIFGPWAAVGVSCRITNQDPVCDRMSLLDFTGRTVIAPKYRRFKFGNRSFEEYPQQDSDCRRPGLFDAGTLAVVDDAGKIGLVDLQGRILVPVQYDQVCTPQEGAARVMRMDPSDPDRAFGTWGLVQVGGKTLLPLNYGFISRFREGVARINEGGHCMRISMMRCRGGKWGLVNPSGEFIAKPRFDWIEPFVNQTAKTLVRPRFGLLRVL
ncbi:MAG: hypothetical protein CVU65_00535 [Deltaproteobacteria bacterium HGW-Deltaproteobacteria-22]|jgi:hypothetical protein|nr:MAG: hypothetical protein CVU65_00535 [Deltaproteobacteria bacterium HGW-Deltaproteobacteria-22]